MPIIPSLDDHRAHVFHGRTMYIVCAASLGLRVVGRQARDQPRVSVTSAISDVVPTRIGGPQKPVPSLT